MTDIYEGMTRNEYAEERAHIQNLCMATFPIWVGKSVMIHPSVPKFGSRVGVITDMFDEKPRLIGVRLDGDKDSMAFGRACLCEPL